MNRPCEVCGTESAVAVVASGLVPASHALCSHCLSIGAETWDTLVWTSANLEKDMREAFESTWVQATLSRTTRTIDEYRAEVEQLENWMMEEARKQEEFELNNDLDL